MKKTIHFFCCLLFFCMSISGFAQNVELSIRYNIPNARYEVFAKPSSSNASFFWGPSQITVVVPASVPDADLLITSVAAGSWDDNSSVFAPTAAANSDFHGVGSLGSLVNFVAGQEKLIFYFTLPGGTCVPGLRVFNNDTDPSSAAAGMGGGDFRNSIVDGTATEAYLINYNNNGTVCETNCGCLDVTVSLWANCQLELTPLMISSNCYDGTVRVMDNDATNGAIIDCPGVWTYGLFDKDGKIICWGKVIAEDKTAPAIVCTDWYSGLLDCYDVNFILNNRQTIGNTNANSSPRPAATSTQTIANAEGTAGDGACGLVPPVLVRDDIPNLGYTYFRDNCRDCGCRTSLKWTDKVVYYGCDSVKANLAYAAIYREWVATDCNGMRRDTVQRIRFVRPALADFGFEKHKDSKASNYSLDKDGYDLVAEYNACGTDAKISLLDLANRDLMPLDLTNYFGDNYRKYLDKVECNYSVQVKDTEFPICNGKGLKVNRELYVFDWCAGGIIDTFHILIKMGDFEAPKLEYAHHAPFDLSTGPMDCTAAFPISVAGIKSTFGVNVVDNCGVSNVSIVVKTRDRYVKGILVAQNVWDKVEYAVMNGSMLGLPVGRHRMIVNAFDGCYNAKQDSFEFEVVDKIAPVMKCDDDLHITLSNANGYTSGYAQVAATNVDEGSWDNCKLSWIALRRNVPAGCTASFIAKGYDTNNNGKLDPAVGKDLNSDGDYNDEGESLEDGADGFDRNGDGDIADFGEAFVLKEGKLMTPLADFVEFFCCDLSERVTIELWGEDASGNRNFCWDDVLLEDKVAPTCVAPWDLTIDCDNKNLEKIDDRAASSTIWGDVTVSSGDDCAALNFVYSTEKKLKCGSGYIDRIWTLTKQTAKGPITITCKQRITILPIREYNICFPKDASSDCKTPIVDTVLTDELGCDALAVNVSDKRYDASDDECYKIFRTYTVINWCAYSDVCGDPMAEGNVYVVNRAHWGNYGKAPIYVLVRDRDRDQKEEFWLSKDLTPNNSDDIYISDNDAWDDENFGGQNKAADVTVSSIPDMPYCAENSEHHHSFMYTQIIKVYDAELPVVTGIRDTFCTDPASCVAKVTKVISLKDNCTNLVELERQQLMIAPFQTLDLGKMITYSTPRWSTADLGNGRFEISTTNLPEGTHDLIVVGRDECGNLSVPTRIPFVVKDCKAPAPICINGLSTELMPDGNGAGMMTVWAKDFVASPIYDCNGQGPETKDGLKVITKYSLNRVGERADASQTSLSLNCSDAGKTVLLELHAWDEAGNHDFCVTFIDVQDNRKLCTSANANLSEISGIISTDELEPVLGVNVDLSGGAQLNQNTAANGLYAFNNLVKGNDYTITAQLDKDPLNGVSTFDLVHIQKHILGIKALETPYRMIAADVNNSKAISTLDMIQIRKLILNIDTKFANAPSWKFVDATYKFPDPGNPWSAPFPEVVNVNDLDEKVKADFIAIKMGDVNGNANVSGGVPAEIRGTKALHISTEEQELKQGQSYTVVFKADDLDQVQGFQFTLLVDPNLASIEGIEYNGIMKADYFGLFPKNGMLTTSFVQAPLAGAPSLASIIDGDTPLFSLKLKAESNTNLSQVLELSSRLTNMEAYSQQDEIMGIKLDFGSGALADQAVLHQNTPNPFADETTIGFYLPKSTQATLSVRDAKGALIYKVEGHYAKGNNQVLLKQQQLHTSGVLYYTLETSDFTETRKMVLIKE